jgi:hypothetical protein
MNKFCFIDSSGIIKQDRFFGTGLLIVKNVGDMGDKLSKNSQPAKQKVKQSKNEKIENLLSQGKKDEVIQILRNSTKFEMKFDTIRLSTQMYYERMIDIFLSDKDNRFSAMIIDKHKAGFNEKGIEDTRETYTKYAAMLIVMEMKNLPDDSFCIVVDEISRPRNKPLSLEDTLLSKVRTEVLKDPTLNLDLIFGAFSIESHSNFLMQLSDLLLGAVMYDYKKRFDMVSPAMEKKKEILVKKLRDTFKVKTLAQDFTENTHAHFHVFEPV